MLVPVQGFLKQASFLFYLSEPNLLLESCLRQEIMYISLAIRVAKVQSLVQEHSGYVCSYRLILMYLGNILEAYLD